MAKPFGYTYLLDMYGVSAAICDNLEINYRFLEGLVDKLGMNKMSQPVVIHGPTLNGVELYPDKAGVSAWVPLIESGIQIHTLAPKEFITLDVYSCGKIDPIVVKDWAKLHFKYSHCEEHFIERGIEYYGRKGLREED